MVSNLLKSKIKNKTCIYCGMSEGTELDHAPPKCFFPTPRPSNLITVPCCGQCNDGFSKNDERVRNLLTSFETTELHEAIESQLASKRNRSLSREKGVTNLKHLIESMFMKDRYSDQGQYLGKFPAFNLDQPLMDRFLNRMTRALLYHEKSIEYIDCHIEWRMAPNLFDCNKMPEKLKQFLSSPATLSSIGDDIFSYAGWFGPKRSNSLWLLNFYKGAEVMILVSEKNSDEK